MDLNDGRGRALLSTGTCSYAHIDVGIVGNNQLKSIYLLTSYFHKHVFLRCDIIVYYWTSFKTVTPISD